MADVHVGGWSGKEQRQHKRVPLQTRITVEHQGKVLRGQSSNISVSGVLVRAESTLPPDAEVRVTFILPDAPEAIRTQARVAHEVPGAFMGLEFTAVSAPQREEIERYVAGVSVPTASSS